VNSNSRNKGFTLIEVLIAIVVFAFIQVGVIQATQSSFKRRQAVIHEGDFHNGIRIAMGILSRDISLAYNPELILPPTPVPSNLPAGSPDPSALQAQRELDTLIATEGQRTSRFWLVASDISGVRPMRLIGTDTSVSFVAASHIRVYKDAPESEFAKITYAVDADPLARTYNPEDAGDTRALVRTASPNAFDDDDSRDPFRKTYVILRGLKRFHFRYYERGRDQWHTAWDSEKPPVKERYPDAIEVSFEATGAGRHVFEGRYLMRPEVPLAGVPSPY